MKQIVFVALFVITSVAGNPPRSEEWMKSVEKCKIKSQVNDEDLKAVINREMPKTREGFCFGACVKKLAGTMHPDNRINLDKIKESLKPLQESDSALFEKVWKIFVECKELEKPETDECEAVKIFANCIIPKKNALMKNS